MNQEGFTDSRYPAFIASRKERISVYKKRKEITNIKYLKASLDYYLEKQNIKQLQEKLVQEEGYSKRDAKKYVKASMLRNKDRLLNARDLKKLETKENHALIYPFKLFYKPVEIDGYGLLKPRFHTLLTSIVVLLLAIICLFFIVFDQADWSLDYFSTAWEETWRKSTAISWMRILCHSNGL